MPDDPISAAITHFEWAARTRDQSEHDMRMSAGRGILLAAAIQKGLGPGEVTEMAAQIARATA